MIEPNLGYRCVMGNGVLRTAFTDLVGCSAERLLLDVP
jgi:hypothetical protein